MTKYASRMALATPSFIRESLKLAKDPSIISFAGGNPDPGYFPWEALRDCAEKAIAADPANTLQYSVTEGYLPLRKKLIERMAAVGVNCELENLVVTTGAQQGLDLVAKMYLDKGDKVIVESPTYMGAINAFKFYEPRFLEAEMDEDGMRMDALEALLQQNPDTKFIYTIPDFQNPTGLCMSRERREQLVELAEKYDVMILEDNPYYYLRYDGEALPPVKHFDKYGRVIYLGSLSKVLCPGLRVGWMVADPKVVQGFVYLKQAADLHVNELGQRMFYEYMVNYGLDEHIAEINAQYKVKKDLMVKLIRELFPADIRYTEPDGGLFLWLTFPEGTDAQQLFNYCHKAEQVIFVPGDTFYPYGGHPNTARMCFAMVPPEKIQEGMERLGRALSRKE